MMLIENRNYLRLHDRQLLENLGLLEQEKLGERIIIESSKHGAPTAKIVLDGKIQYIHSKYDPNTEAKKLIDQIEGINEYNHILFIGTGLGYHINELLNRCPNMSFSIYEPDLEMLYQFLSYQSINDLTKKNFKGFIISKNEGEIRTAIQNSHKTKSTKTFVYTLPSYSKRYNLEEFIIMQTLKELLKNKRSSLATDVSFQKRWTINSIKNFPKVLTTPNILHDINKDAFNGKPAIIVAAGPSLNEEFENLKLIKEKGLAYIFSVGSAINALIEHDIYPDAACTYDPTEKNQIVFEKIKERKISNIPLIFGSSVGYETLDNYPGKMLHMLTNQDTVAPYYLKSHENLNVVLDAPSIAIITFQLLNMLGCSQIVLVGQNLGFQNDKRYAEGINYNFVKNELSEHEKNGLFPIKDVYGNEILTNDVFNRMRQQLEMFIQLFSNLEVINTTKGGAHIAGTDFMPLNEVIVDKWKDTRNVTSNWFEGENLYNLSFLQMKLNDLQPAKRSLDQAINNVTKELRDINKAVNMNQLKNLDKKFIRFDKEFNKMRDNSYFKAFIEPMVRVHNQRLSEESQVIRFETDLLKKGRAVAQMFASFLIDCQIHIKELEPYVQELTEDIERLVN